MKWQLLYPETVTTLDQFKEVLLQNRDLKGKTAKEFFAPTQPIDLSLKDVGFSTQSVKTAITLLKKHKDKKILIFGDYDADGICATAVMWLTLHSLGYTATPFLPHRAKHGYGISNKALDMILSDPEQRPDLVISVDNGIVAHEPVARLRKEGIEVIITDHHQPESELPAVSAIVHTTRLCGTTVSWMLAREILRAHHDTKKADEVAVSLLDLCGIATIADQVPLLKANRSFAIAGIEALKTTSRPGIKALCEAADMLQVEITTDSVNYVLAPRLNAMGRLDHAMDALRLLCTGKLETARKLASVLQLTNIKRQGLTDAMLKDAETQAESFKEEHIIIVASEKYHEGVIGLIAGRLSEKYTKPAIAISLGKETAKASARSIMGINVVDLIREVRSDLLEVGGHPMAAGFGLETNKLEIIRQRLQDLAKAQITADMLEPTLRIECQLDFSLLTMKLAQVVREFEPFGQNNPKPIIQLCNLRILDYQAIGKQHQHLKLLLTDEKQDNQVTALGWSLASTFTPNIFSPLSDICATVEVNTWKNHSNLQLILKSLANSTVKPELISRNRIG